MAMASHKSVEAEWNEVHRQCQPLTSTPLGPGSEELQTKSQTHSEHHRMKKL